MRDSSSLCSKPKRHKTETAANPDMTGSEPQKKNTNITHCRRKHIAHLKEVTQRSWENAPYDVLLRVFRLLPVQDLGRVAAVCSHWHRVAQCPQLWQSIEFVLADPLRSYLPPTSPRLIEYILRRHAQHLKFVVFKTDSSVESAEMACQILSRLVNCSLKTLALISSARPVFLDMDQESFVSALTVVFDRSHSLRSLAIDNTPVDDPSLKALASSSSRTLQLLRMKSCPRVSQGGVLALADHCHCLRELSLSYSLLSDELLLALSSEKHVSLEYLHIDVYATGDGDSEIQTPQRISPHCWHALVRHSPAVNLVMYFFRVPAGCLEALFASYVPATNLYFGDGVPRQALTAVAGHCPRLRELVVGGGEPLTECELPRLAAGCPRLVSLGLAECEVSCRAFVEFVRVCGPRLRELYVTEECLVEDADFDLARTCEVVSQLLGREWTPEFMPMW